FVVRLLVQVPLYLTGHTTALGFANIPLGLPLFLLTAAGTWAILRSTHPVHPADVVEAEEDSTDRVEVDADPEGSVESTPTT
ncbi:MAG TPA: DUF3159 domain-containing protein, partial [Dermatophilaceae bacterium]|nr:DUF3159 domain-containing protein [Dermatophilaceae bacterium]